MAIKRAREGAPREGIANIAIKRKASLFFISADTGMGGGGVRKADKAKDITAGFRRRDAAGKSANQDDFVFVSVCLCVCVCHVSLATSQ